MVKVQLTKLDWHCKSTVSFEVNVVWDYKFKNLRSADPKSWYNSTWKTKVYNYIVLGIQSERDEHVQHQFTD